MPRNIWLRAALFAAIVAGGFLAIRFTPLAGYLNEEKIVALFQALRRSWWAPLVLIALYTLTSPLGTPVSVYMLGAGAVFGFAEGSLYNMVGLMLGAAASYYLARALGRDFVIYVTRGKLRRYERAFERGGFWPLVQTRFVPIPFAIVNFGAALAGIKAPLFFSTTALGVVPATLIHTYFISRIFEASGGERWGILVWYFTVLAVMNALISYPSVKSALRRRRRYREITAARRSRGTGDSRT